MPFALSTVSSSPGRSPHTATCMLPYSTRHNCLQTGSHRLLPAGRRPAGQALLFPRSIGTRHGDSYVHLQFASLAAYPYLAIREVCSQWIRAAHSRRIKLRSSGSCSPVKSGASSRPQLPSPRPADSVDGRKGRVMPAAAHNTTTSSVRSEPASDSVAYSAETLKFAARTHALRRFLALAKISDSLRPTSSTLVRSISIPFTE
jgi:hypothetical protein